MARREKSKEKKRQEISREDQLAQKEGKIVVRICSRENGLEVYEKVKFIRVVSKRYNLLIMADYLPVIGEIDGYVFFRDEKEEYRREQLKGYFMHKKNQFSLMLESEGETTPKETNVKRPEEEGRYE